MYRLGEGELKLWVDVTRARVVRLALDGVDALADPATSPSTYGGALSLGLASEPDRYDAHVESDTLELASQPSSDRGVRVVKRYRLEAGRRAFELSATVRNETSAPLRLTPQERCYLPPVGLSFYPSRGSYPQSSLKVDSRAGASWLIHEQSRAPSASISLADGSEGWLAFAARDVLLVRTFPDLAEAERAPGRAEIELAIERDGPRAETRAISASQQSAAGELGPGQTRTLTTRWYVRRLPPSMALTPGNPELLGFVRGIIQ